MFEKIQRGLELFGRHLLFICAIMLTLLVPSSIGTIVLMPDPKEFDFEKVWMLYAWIFGYSTLASALMLGALMIAVHEIVEGRPVGYWQALSRSAKRWPAMVATYVLMYLLMAIVGALCFIPAFMFFLSGSRGLGFLVILPAMVVFGLVTLGLMSWLLLAPFAVVLDGMGPIQGIKRSVRLTEGKRLELFGVYILLMAVALGPGVVLQQTIQFAGLYQYIPLRLAVDVGCGVLGSLLTIVPYFYYREAREKAGRLAREHGGQGEIVLPPLEE